MTTDGGRYLQETSIIDNPPILWLHKIKISSGIHVFLIFS